MEDKEHPNNQDEQTEKERQEQENIASNKRMAQTGLKGVATAAGAYFGGAAGAKIGSKAADVINNTPVGDALTDAAGKVGNVTNKMSPNGDTNQKLINAAANSGVLDLADKGIDAAAGGINPSSSQSGNIPTNNVTAKPSNVNNQTLNNTNNANNINNPTNPTASSNNGDNNKINITVERTKKDNKPSSSNQRENDKYNRASRKHSASSYTQEEDDSAEEQNEPQDSENKTDKKKKNKGFINQLQNITKAVPALAGILGVIGNFIITHLSVISAFLIVSIVVSLIASLVSLIGDMFIYSQDDDGNTCYVSPTCTKVTVKSDETEKNMELSEYIAGVIVKYYNYEDFADINGNVSDELIKALAIIIHSDISAFSDYDYTTETCKAIESNKFLDVYIPTTNNADVNEDDNETEGNLDQDDSDKDLEDSTNSTDDSTSSTDDSNQQEDTENSYYNQAKKDTEMVLSEVVDIYNSHFNLFYDNYQSILKNAASSGLDYKQIAREYLKNDPNYTEDESKADEVNEDEKNEKDGIGVYPICEFKKDNTGTGPISYSSDICSTVHINSGTDAGDYDIEKFIEGVVYNEAQAWTNSMDTLKAHAVAARTYLVNRGKVENGTCYIETGTTTMGFTNATNSAIHQAVTETSGEYIMVNGQISKEAEWDALCIKNPNTTGTMYTICQKNQQIPKEWFSKITLFGTISWYNKHSHGRGMSQYGAYYLATVQGKNYKEIINYYYGADVGTVGTESKKDYVMPINSFSYINGEITGYCDGSNNAHTGIDFVAIKGTPVYAAHSGIVDNLYDTNYQCGKSCKKGQKEGLGVKIKNSDGTYSLYMHFSARENLVRGQKIEAGQKLGEVGNTGSARGNNGGYHLHYQMQTQSNGTRTILNPRDYLPLDEKGYGVCYKP